MGFIKWSSFLNFELSVNERCGTAANSRREKSHEHSSGEDVHDESRLARVLLPRWFPKYGTIQKEEEEKKKNITKQSWNSLRISQLDPLVKQGKRCILDVRHAYWMCRCKLSRGSSFQATGSRLLLPIPNYFTMVQTSIFFLIVFINRVGAAEGNGASTSCAVQSRTVE